MNAPNMSKAYQAEAREIRARIKQINRETAAICRHCEQQFKMLSKSYEAAMRSQEKLVKKLETRVGILNGRTA